MLDYIKEKDNEILSYINDNYRNKRLDKVMPIVTALGDLGIIWVVIGALLIRNLDYRKTGVMIFLALILTTIIGEGIIKHIVKRKRPTICISDSILIVKPSTYSFPSGHTASSFAVSAIFLNNSSIASGTIITIAILIAFSRLYLNVHYPSDVIAGGIIGLACGMLVAILY